MATATNKNYLVIGGDGAELKTVKTLAAAKKLADAEGGSVLEDGKRIYTAEATAPAEVGEPEKEWAEEKPEKYRIKTLMNIRREPGLTGEKVGIAKQGSIVSVKRVKDDWLHLTDGTFILFGGGEFAEKA